MDSKKLTKTNLTKYTRQDLIRQLLDQQDTIEKQSKQLDELNHNLLLLIEQMKLSTQARFGQSSENFRYQSN